MSEIDIPSYQFNHPKNYLGYAVALAHTRSEVGADNLTEKYVVGSPDMARRGAENFGLVDDGELTQRGEWATTEIRHRLVDGDRLVAADGCLEVLELFDDARGTRTRFIEEFDELSEIAPGIAMGDPAIARVVNCLREIHYERQGEDIPYSVPTVDLFFELHLRDEAFATELLIHDHPAIREAIEGDDIVALKHGSLDGTTTYRSATTYQLHNLLWHMGVVLTKGVQAKDLDPEGHCWALKADILHTIGMFASVETAEREVA